MNRLVVSAVLEMQGDAIIDGVGGLYVFEPDKLNKRSFSSRL
nr:hypothetical protein [Pseudomonas rhodesiae]